MTHYGQTGRHPQNRKHTSLSSEDDKATATVNVYRKLNEVFVFDVRADRHIQTYRHDHRNTGHPYRGELTTNVRLRAQVHGMIIPDISLLAVR